MRGFCLEVSGPYACFTRPEMKVERVSYDVITPSSARAIYDAILWKPAIRWHVNRIEVLSPLRWISVRRNEVGKVASPRSGGILIEDDRQQRAGLFLRDVKYRIFAEFEYIPPAQRGKTCNPAPEYLVDAEDAADLRKDESPAKYAAMFERRARKGQCFNQPYFGCREFAVDFRLVNQANEPASPINETRDLGWMLYDLDFTDPDNVKPLFFRAEMKNGVINTDRNQVEVRG
ncbi:MAG TPA: type I-C CRISPR-associated protein Cas5c [Kiritimatiellia bacterium]|nr:type I-C CRISPR-associated protein Cas5c [Kiritimatiellia bacterium]HMP33727.1 type I-C CRISPR-associated protein Cas5c [Kiritimatiellia bacterium]